jgi:hypothetical protein
VSLHPEHSRLRAALSMMSTIRSQARKQRLPRQTALLQTHFHRRLRPDRLSEDTQMSKVQFTFDKKQMPQVIGLGVLSAAMFAYFTVKIITPPPAERVSASVIAAPNSATTITAVKAVETPADVAIADLISGPPPTSSMRDPFWQPWQAPSKTAPDKQTTSQTQPASLPQGNLGPLAPMPSSSAVQPLSALNPAPAPAPPAPIMWKVVGVLAGSTSGERIAVLRNGDARRFVALGGMVDDQCQLIGIDRFGVTLRQGKQHIRLLLEDSETKSSKKPAADSLTSFPGETGSLSSDRTQSPAYGSTVQQPAGSDSVPAQLPSGMDVPAPAN